MFILRDIFKPLQDEFSDCKLGQKRASWFAYTLLAVIIPFTSSITSNLLRSLQTLFGIRITQRCFYTFMASSMLPWQSLWLRLWRLIPEPLTGGRLLVAPDDTISSKTGRKIFGCGFFHDHTAKINQPSYPWSQCIVNTGLIKLIKGRWACLPLAFRFYCMKKDIGAKTVNTKFGKASLNFETKMEQAAVMLESLASCFAGTRILVVTDSWFGNNGLWKLLPQQDGAQFGLLSRLRSNNTLYDMAKPRKAKQRGRSRKYGDRLGSVSECAEQYRHKAKPVEVFLYGKNREVLVCEKVLMLRTLKTTVRVVWAYRKTQWVAFFTTDLSLSVPQIISFYGARWKIESGFKELKQEIGSQKSQTRNAHSVLNHLNFCMMASTIIWIYAAKIKPEPERRHKVKGRTSFAFSDVRRLVANAALDEDFHKVLPVQRQNPINSFIPVLLRMVA